VFANQNQLAKTYILISELVVVCLEQIILLQACNFLLAPTSLSGYTEDAHSLKFYRLSAALHIHTGTFLGGTRN